MATTPTKPPTNPTPPPAHGPGAVAPSPAPRTAPAPKDNPLAELAEKQRQDEQKRREALKETEADSKSLAERETLATGERRQRQAAGIEDEHYLKNQADNERAQIEERVEEQAAAKRHPVTGETVIVTGVPPRPDMAREDDRIDESTVSEATRAEMNAGREALRTAGRQGEAEQAAGKKALQNRADTHKPHDDE